MRDASSLLSMALNLLAMDGLQPTSKGLQHTSDDLQPNSDKMPNSEFVERSVVM